MLYKNASFGINKRLIFVCFSCKWYDYNSLSMHHMNIEFSKGVKVVEVDLKHAALGSVQWQFFTLTISSNESSQIVLGITLQYSPLFSYQQIPQESNPCIGRDWDQRKQKKPRSMTSCHAAGKDNSDMWFLIKQYKDRHAKSVVARNSSKINDKYIVLQAYWYNEYDCQYFSA